MKNSKPIFGRARLVGFGLFFFLTSFALSAQEAAQITKGELVPLEDLKPLETSSNVLNTHGFNGGLSTVTSGYYDSSLKQMLFMGFYRPYATYLLNENHLFTLRGKWSWTQFTKDIATGSGNTTVKKESLNRSVGSVEVVSAELNFDRTKITAGRAFYKIGRGLIFANFADGAQIVRQYRWGQTKLLGLYSGEYGKDLCALSVAGCGAVNPYDVVPGRSFDAQLVNAGKRFFGGLGVSSAPLWGNSISGNFLYSKDFNTAMNTKGLQFTYDTWYASLAAQGFILSPEWIYRIEYVYQGGTTIDDSTQNSTAQIHAHALQADVTYTVPLWKETYRPAVIAQYAFGSGDSDRSNGTNAAQVNTKGSDTGFYHFGTFSGGLGLMPRLQNLHVARLGVMGRPLGNFYAFRNFVASLKYTLYRKAVADAPTSDLKATEKNADVGHGFDATLVYDFRSDVKFFYGFGLFKRGQAYKSADRSLVQVHLISVTLNF